MTMGIRLRVLLLGLVPAALGALAIGLYQLRTRVQDLDAALRDRGQAIVNQLAPALEYPVIAGNPALLRPLARAVLREPDVVSFEVRTPPGDVLFREASPRAAPAAGSLVRFEAPIYLTPIEVAGAEPAAPAEPRVLGRLVVTLSTHALSQRQRTLVMTSLLIMAASLLGAGVVGWSLGRAIAGPIRRLRRAVIRLRDGDLGVRVHQRSVAELGELERGFNTMASALATAQDQMARQVSAATQELRIAIATLAARNEELDQARARAEAGERIKSEFLATMSHEIRTPLHGVSGFLRLLARTPLTPRQQEYLHLLTTSADSLLGLLNGLLDFVKMESRQVELHRERCHLPAIVECAVYLFTANAQAKGLDLTLSIAPEVPPSVMGDGQRLNQVITNLVSNAVKFTEHGEVAVQVDTVARTADRVTVRIAVRDTGPGIAPALHEAIFQPFRQLDASLSRPHEGSGLGLAICRHLVTLMGGDLLLESTVGVGSTFTVSLPLAVPGALDAGRDRWPAEPEQPPRVPRASGPPFASRRVLVVDDNTVNRRFARMALAALTPLIEEAASGPQALAACANTRYDVILLDIRMPGMDGVEVARRLRGTAGGLNQRTPLIGITADLLGLGRADLMAAGFDDRLVKPLSPDDLEAAFRRWLTGDAAP